MFSLISTTSFGQSNVVQLLPEVGQGYLVLNKTDNPNVEYWKITINKRTMNEDSTFNDISEELVTLPSGCNYWEVPEEYKDNTSSQHYRFNVFGMSSSNDTVAYKDFSDLYYHHIPPLCPNCGNKPPFKLSCSWKCNGPDYAWEIVQYAQSQSGLSYFKLERGYSYFDSQQHKAIPYYAYTNNLNAYLNQHNHGASIIELNVDSVCDSRGSIITGVVHGVEKNLGPWEGSAIMTQHLSIGPDCKKTRNWVMTELNNYGSFMNGNTGPFPYIKCTEIPCVAKDTSVRHNSPPCSQSEIWAKGGMSLSWFDALAKYIKCLEKHGIFGKPLLGDSVFEAWDSVNEFILTDLNNPNNPPIHIGVNESKDINPSLWCVGVVFKNGYYLPIITETTANMDFHIPYPCYCLADYLDVSIYPVPIINNQFNITLNNNDYTSLNVHYELRDFMGNQYFVKDFIVYPYTPINYSFTMAQLPSGILFNRFVLDDGSIKSIETLK